MQFDFDKLCGRIIEKYGTRERFAEAMGRPSGWLSVRLNNRVHWDAEDIMLAAELLDIAPAEIHVFFLTPKVR